MEHGVVEYSLRHASSNRKRIDHSSRTMTEQYLTLALGSAGIRASLGLTHFKVGFHIDVCTFLEMTKVIVRVRVKGNNVMPGSLGLRTSCQSDASVPQSYLRDPRQTYCHRNYGEAGDNWSWQQSNYDAEGYNEVLCMNRSCGAYEMNSFSFFVTRTSGSLPRRPIRTTLDKSEERAAVEEKAYIIDVMTLEKCCGEKKNPREQSQRVAGGGGRTWTRSSRKVSRSVTVRAASPQPHV